MWPQVEAERPYPTEISDLAQEVPCQVRLDETLDVSKASQKIKWVWIQLLLQLLCFPVLRNIHTSTIEARQCNFGHDGYNSSSLQDCAIAISTGLSPQ